MRRNNTNQALTQAFMETLFFLYQIIKKILINHKEVGAHSFLQVFFSFKKNYVEQTHAVMPKESLIVGQNTHIKKYIF